MFFKKKKEIEKLNRNVKFNKLKQLSLLFENFGLEVSNVNLCWSGIEPAIKFIGLNHVTKRNELLEKTIESEKWIIGRFKSRVGNAYQKEIFTEYWFDYHKSTNEKIEDDIEVMKIILDKTNG